MDPIERFENKLDKLADDMTYVKVTLGQQHVSLENHMARSDALEEANAIMRQELEPVKRHVVLFAAGAKIFVGLAAVVGLVGACVELWQRFTGR